MDHYLSCENHPNLAYMAGELLLCFRLINSKRTLMQQWSLQRQVAAVS